MRAALRCAPQRGEERELFPLGDDGLQIVERALFGKGAGLEGSRVSTVRNVYARSRRGEHRGTGRNSVGSAQDGDASSGPLDEERWEVDVGTKRAIARFMDILP
mmetsp:Transcript_31403/g.71837  ORF Transcript_31403/g.71837 Transcript_31403/m.71837 type:complete len:104 (+) Transcript_31403:2532-2843(+)